MSVGTRGASSDQATRAPTATMRTTTTALTTLAVQRGPLLSLTQITPSHDAALPLSRAGRAGRSGSRCTRRSSLPAERCAAHRAWPPTVLHVAPEYADALDESLHRRKR